MWAYVHHFHTKDVDDGHLTQYCGMDVEFDKYNCFIHRDKNLIDGKLGYVGKIQEIMQLYFSSFQCVIFKWKWWDTFNWNDKKVDHDSGLICINSKKKLVETKYPYVFPKHCNQVFCYPDVLDWDWWFVLIHSSRPTNIFEKNNVVIQNNEYNHGDGNEECVGEGKNDSQLDSWTFGMAGSTGIWTRYHLSLVGCSWI